MRRTHKLLIGSASGAAALLSTGVAGAQLSDLQQPLPNVLLILDTSGSMEYKADGTLPLASECQPLDANSVLTRWQTVVEVLGGTIQNRGCYVEDRGTGAFVNEFGRGSNDPYDYQYHLPFHRAVSNGCMATPGLDPAAIHNWGTDPFRYRPYNGPYQNGRCDGTVAGEQWVQDPDGILDIYRDRVRFALTTFDSHPDDDTGINGGATDYGGGFLGLWSYFDGWENGGNSPIVGHPANCTPSGTNQIWEVGVRNFGAPPWEGKMVPFGPSGADIQFVRTNNDRIQAALPVIRPYGGTPIAGALDDAWVFFHEDTSIHPDPQINEAFAPAGDPLVTEGCRENFIILLSDGEPNQDLRTACEESGSPNGLCPYKLPWERARDLYTGTPAIKTFTIGFGLSGDGSSYDCTTISMPGDLGPGQQCENPTGGLKACCVLAQIAYEGGTTNALFADDKPGLRAAIAAVLDQIVTQSTSRTLPVFASAASTVAASDPLAPAVSYEFATAFRPDQGQLWTSSLERVRYACENDGGGTFVPEKQIPIDATKGDDFALNLESTAPARQFLTFFGDPVNGTVLSDRSIRPLLTSDDGLGLYGGTQYFGSATTLATAAQGNPTALGIDTTMPAGCTTSDMQASSAAQCAFRLMNWQLGGTNAGLPSRVGSQLGAIYHSTPQVHDRPVSFVRDGAYELFADSNQSRPLMMYTATVDGLMHGFKIAANDASDTVKVNQQENNEVFAFLPPAVLPRLLSQYPATPQILLDGAVAVKDVPFERTIGDAESASAVWKSVLVGGGYLGGGFYYAIDITDPENPTFLWQLSTDAAGTPIFGNISGNPAIATIAINENNSGTKEVAVAILPGGQGQSCPGTQPRQVTTFNHIRGFHDGNLSPTTAITPDDQVRCWVDDESNNVTIVELATGRVIRSFRGDTGGAYAVNAALVTDAPFDSPITDVVPFPNRTGDVSNRIYASDMDGTLWRIDVSNPDPDLWEAHIFFDAYPDAPSVTSGRQPVPHKPVISVDGVGNTVILYTTGDNEDLTSASVNGTVWSLTELPIPVASVAPFTVLANWVLSPNTAPAFAAGERVIGPVAVFDEVAYFSTFIPPANSIGCDYGEGKIYAVDFSLSDQSALPAPLARFDDGAGGFKYNPDGTDSPDLANGATIFGVSVVAEPTCAIEDTITDDYVGQHSTTRPSIPMQFKLRFHTGVEGQAATGSNVKAGELPIPTPRVLTRIDSWAGVIE